MPEGGRHGTRAYTFGARTGFIEGLERAVPPSQSPEPAHRCDRLRDHGLHHGAVFNPDQRSFALTSGETSVVLGGDITGPAVETGPAMTGPAVETGPDRGSRYRIGRQQLPHPSGGSGPQHPRGGGAHRRGLRRLCRPGPRVRGRASALGGTQRWDHRRATALAGGRRARAAGRRRARPSRLRVGLYVSLVGYSGGIWSRQSAWEDREGKPYVPARYGACFWQVDSPPDFEAVLDLLPASAQALLRGSDPAAWNPRCLVVTPEEARSLDGDPE